MSATSINPFLIAMCAVNDIKHFKEIIGQCRTAFVESAQEPALLQKATQRTEAGIELIWRQTTKTCKAANIALNGQVVALAEVLRKDDETPFLEMKIQYAADSEMGIGEETVWGLDGGLQNIAEKLAKYMPEDRKDSFLQALPRP